MRDIQAEIISILRVGGKMTGGQMRIELCKKGYVSDYAIKRARSELRCRGQIRFDRCRWILELPESVRLWMGYGAIEPAKGRHIKEKNISQPLRTIRHEISGDTMGNS